MDLFRNPDTSPLIIAVLFLWSMFWKVISLWRSAKGNQKYWFVALLIVDSLGILNIIYLFRFAKNKLTLDELKGWLEFK